MTTKDYIAVEIELFQGDEGRPYLTINDNGDVEPLKDYQWAQRSYGPISKD